MYILKCMVRYLYPNQDPNVEIIGGNFLVPALNVIGEFFLAYSSFENKAKNLVDQKICFTFNNFLQVKPERSFY